jgi:hypothetical protein
MQFVMAASPRFRRWKLVPPWRPTMSTNTILIIVVLILLFGGGGFFWSRRG